MVPYICILLKQWLEDPAGFVKRDPQLLVLTPERTANENL